MEKTKDSGRVLVVDDEESITFLLEKALTHEGWSVETAANGAEAIAKSESFKPDVIVLDIMLPDFDGMQVLSKLRKSGDDVPVVFLTAKTAVDDKVAGLTAGGDDYVTKPFSLEELSARLRAVVRRSSVQADYADAAITVGDLHLNEDTFAVRRADKEIELSTTEFELLRFMMRNEGTVLSKAQIIDRVWSYDFRGKETVVELYISYLRKKVDSGMEPMIHTVRGSGYVLRAA